MPVVKNEGFCFHPNHRQERPFKVMSSDELIIMSLLLPLASQISNYGFYDNSAFKNSAFAFKNSAFDNNLAFKNSNYDKNSAFQEESCFRYNSASLFII